MIRSVAYRLGLAAAAAIAVVALGSCSLDPAAPGPAQPALSAAASAAAPAANAQSAPRNFRAHLSGAGSGVDTQAQGQAVFQLNGDGTELSYKLIAANVENITQAHIHLAPEGSNGPIVAWLYPPAPPSLLIPDRFDGVLAEGTITDASLVGPLAGQPLAALLDAMRSGGAYVNLHTLQVPSGEIRGQIH